MGARIKLGCVAAVVLSAAACDRPHPVPRVGSADRHGGVMADKAAAPPGSATSAGNDERVVRSEEEWRRILDPMQFHVLRQSGTERAFTGAFWNSHEPATYACAGCGNILFDSSDKFDSGCGWPSFTKALRRDAVKYIEDRSHGMVRTEVRCARCDGHLGHVFPDGPPPIGDRFCMNSAALKQLPKQNG